MNKWQLLLAVVFLSVVCLQFGVEAATITVSIHNEAPVLVPVHLAGKEWRVGTPGNEMFTHETAQGKIQLVGALDPDPMITFGAAVTDFGAPSDFSFVFNLPLVPVVASESLALDSFSDSVTNAAGPGVLITALPPPAGIPVDGDGITELEVFTLSNDGGVTWQNVGLDLMPTTNVPLGVGNSGNSPAFNEGPITVTPTLPWTNMRADVNFRLSGGGDIFTFNGAKVLIPEPGTLTLLWVALAACYLGRRQSVR
jgi:hypothetical protein